MLKLLSLSGFLLLSNIIVQGQMQNECRLSGETPLKHRGTHNYVIDLLSNILRFPFAINQCTSTDLYVSNRWYKYMCTQQNSSEDYMVTKTEYSTSDCSDNGTLLTDWMVESPEYFECDGTNTYVELLLSSSNDCDEGMTVFAGLGACVVDDSGLGQYDIYCNSSMAVLQLYQTDLTETTYIATDIFSTSEAPSTTQTISTTPFTSSTGVSTTSTLGVSTTSTTGVSTTSTIGATTSTTGVSTTSTPGISTTSTTATDGTTSTAQSLGRAIIPTEIITTWLGSVIEGEASVCEDANFCDVWAVSRRRCTSSDFTVYRNASITVYGKMQSCHSTIHQATLPGSSSIRPHLAISGLITLLLFICML